MDLERVCRSDKSHSEARCISQPPHSNTTQTKPYQGAEHDEEHGRHHAADYHEKHKTEEKVLDEDGEKERCKSFTSDIHEVKKDGKEESLMWNLQQKDSTRLDVRVSKSENCEECDNHMLAKSSCGGSAQKTTRRTTLRELMQLPADYESPSRNSLMSESKTSEHLARQEQEKLEKLEVVPKQYKRLGFLKRFKGLSWSSLFKPRDRENNKPQRNNNEGIFAKVTKLCRKNQTPESERKIKRSPGTKSSSNKEGQRNLRGNGGLQPHWASSPCGCCDEVCSLCRCGDGACLPFGCGDGKMDLRSSFGVEHDEEHRENELDEDGDKEGCKTSSLGTHHEVKIDVNEEVLMRNLQQKDLTHPDLRVSNDDMCEEYSDHMFAKSSYGGFAQKTTSQNASALIYAEYGSPNENTAAALMSQSKIWEYFELIEEEERLKKLEAVPKEYKWWGILNGDKGLSWSSLLKPRDTEKTIKKPRRRIKKMFFSKVTKLCRKNHTPESERKIKRSSGRLGRNLHASLPGEEVE